MTEEVEVYFRRQDLAKFFGLAVVANAISYVGLMVLVSRVNKNERK